jgi:tetratricopeptide (TPR) repeat protein
MIKIFGVFICALAILTDCKQADETLISAVKSVEAHYSQFIQSRNKDSLRKAVKAQRRVVKLIPKDFEATYNLANLIYMLSTDDEEARKLAEEAVHLKPDSAKALKLLGRIYVQLGKSEHGLPFLLQSLAIVPTDAECWYKVGAVYFERGELNNAATCFKSAAHMSGDSFYLLSAAHTLHKLSQPRAFSFYWAAVRAKPTMLDAWNDLTFALSSTRSHRMAEITARKAFNLQPTAINLFTVANSIMSQGIYDKAIDAYEQAVAMEPGNMDILHNLAFTRLLADRPVPAAEASLAAVATLLHGNGTTTDPSGVPSLGPTFIVGLANALRRIALFHPPESDLAAHLEQLAVTVLAPLRQPPAPLNQVPRPSPHHVSTVRWYGCLHTTTRALPPSHPLQ